MPPISKDKVLMKRTGEENEWWGESPSSQPPVEAATNEITARARE